MSNMKNKLLILFAQKVLIIIFLLIGLYPVERYKVNGSNSIFFTVYHIYSDEKYIGVLSDERMMEELVQNKLEKYTLQFDKDSLVIGNKLVVVPEVVFSFEIEDEAILKRLEEQLYVKVEAVAITVDGVAVGYVSDQDKYAEVIRNLLLQTVTEEEIIKLEQKSEAVKVSKLPVHNEAEIILIDTSKDLKGITDEVIPSEVMRTEEAIEFLTNGKVEKKKYQVKKGDFINSIADEHGMTIAELLTQNPNLTEESVLYAEEELVITVAKPFVEIDVYYEINRIESVPFNKKVVEDDSFYVGEQQVTQIGVDGKKIITEQVRKRDKRIINRSFVAEESIVQPIDEITTVGSKLIPTSGTGAFIWPTNDGYISSGMGPRWSSNHRGIDIARPLSYEIVASDHGVVKHAGWKSNYGYRIVIDHNNGYETLYAHLASIDVAEGQLVHQGMHIGVMGTTGRSTGIHLHFEMLDDESLINPLSMLDESINVTGQ